MLGEHCGANNPPEGYFAFSDHITQAGAHLPLRSYFIDVLEYFGIAPLQLSPNGYAILIALFVIYNEMGFPQPTPLEVNYMYTLKRIPNGEWFLLPIRVVFRKIEPYLELPFQSFCWVP